MENKLNSSDLAKAKLALQVIPVVAKQRMFALKGGAAINYFLQDTPRISVDLDLCYIPLRPRKESLEEIADGMAAIGNDFKRLFPDSHVVARNKSELGTPGTLQLTSRAVDIKIEPNFVLRGNVLPVGEKEAVPNVKELIGGRPRIQTLATEEIYAGKVCAALDRQLPRDLFDVNLMFDKIGFTEKLKDTFLVYLVYQNRPIEEILNPHRLNFTSAGVENLKQMAILPYSDVELKQTREKLIEVVNRSLTDRDKEFLLSIMSDSPRFDLAPFPDLEKFPGVQWKLKNVAKMDKKKRDVSRGHLEDSFNRGMNQERLP